MNHIEEMFTLLGVQTRNDDLTFRDFDAVMGDLSKVWSGLNKNQKNIFTFNIFKK